MKKWISIGTLIFGAGCLWLGFANDSRNITGTPIDPDVLRSIYPVTRYEQITDRRFDMEAYLTFSEELTQVNTFAIDTAGWSSEGRPIYSVRWGRGQKRVLLWARMHGDEPTAYMAMMDLFRWLQDTTRMMAFKNTLADSITLIGIPCLNPDGAVRYQRKNFMDIDINRDAAELASPEARVLRTVFDSFQPDWAMNLHDQSPYYGIRDISTEVYFSFQVPPASENGMKTPAMELAGALAGQLIEGLKQRMDASKIALYPVRYTANAFGEYFQQTGVPTLLIEAGFRWDDPEKQWLREQHWILFIELLEAIASDIPKNEPGKAKVYDALPACEITQHDMVIENIRIPNGKKMKQADLGFRNIWQACAPDGPLRSVGYLATIGEPYALKGRQYLNGSRYTATPGMTFPDTLDDINAMLSLPLSNMAAQGFLQFQVTTGPDTCTVLPAFPLAINRRQGGKFTAGQVISFFMKNEDGSSSLFLHNGHVHHIDSLNIDYCQRFLKYPTNEKDQ